MSSRKVGPYAGDPQPADQSQSEVLSSRRSAASFPQPQTNGCKGTEEVKGQLVAALDAEWMPETRSGKKSRSSPG